MSYLYYILGIIGWTLTPLVILAYAFWPRIARGLPRDSKEKSIP